MNGWAILGIVIVSAVLLLSVGLSGCFEQNEENSNAIDESKNKLAVIVKKEGIYDTDRIHESLRDFLVAVKNDLDIDNVGVRGVDATILEDVDIFVEQLYYDEDVGYLVMIGIDLVCNDNWEEWKEVNLLEMATYELSSLEENELDNNEYAPPYYDIAISWIIAPHPYSDSEKRDFVHDVINTYTEYHIAPQNILNQFNHSFLYIEQSWYDDPSKFATGHTPSYQFPGLKLMNTEYSKIKEEMKKKPLILNYHVHGTWNKVEIGLSIEENDINKMSTTLEEYAGFIQENGLPSLFVDAGTCYWSAVVNVTSQWRWKLCCWPQINIGNGVWAYYNSLDTDSLQKMMSEGYFFGYALRHIPKDPPIIIGDITAHMI